MASTFSLGPVSRRRLLLSSASPALATVTIFGFMAHWNDFMGPLIYLTSRENATLTLGLRYFISANSTQFQYLMAISFLMSLPIILVFFGDCDHASAL